DAYLQPLHASEGARVLGALRALAAAPAGTRMLWAVSDSGQYPAFIGRGLLAQGRLPALQPAWQLPASASRPFCVTDETVARLYGERLGELAGKAVIAPGERHKTLASAQRVWQA